MKNYILIGLAFILMIGVSIWLVKGTDGDSTQAIDVAEIVNEANNTEKTPPAPPLPPAEQTNYITDDNTTEKNSFVLDDNAIRQAQIEEEAKQKRLKEEQELQAKLQELKEKEIVKEQQEINASQVSENARFDNFMKKSNSSDILIEKNKNNSNEASINQAGQFTQEQKFIEYLKGIKDEIIIYPDGTFKYKNKIYQAKDKFLDKYIVDSVDSVSIRFLDNNFAYSLRFIEE